MKRIVLFVALCGLLACGGRIEDPTPGGSAGGDSAPVSSGSSGTKAGSSDPLPSQELGDCKPGFDRASNPARACNWLTDSGICFDTKDDACACICPSDKNSTCYSSFDKGTGSETPVHCD